MHVCVCVFSASRRGDVSRRIKLCVIFKNQDKCLTW